MNLIPEQVLYLRNEINKLKSSIRDYEGYFTNKNSYDFEDRANSFFSDCITESQFSSTKKKIIEYENLLMSSEYIMKPTLDKIGIGTKFSVKFDDALEEENFILVDALVGTALAEEAISVSSPLGESLNGKAKGEVFYYEVNGNTISGVVKDINTNREDYVSYIRSRKLKNRHCSDYLKKEHDLKQKMDNDAQARKEYESLYEITVSQYELLEIQKKRFESMLSLGIGKVESIRSKLAAVNKYLTSNIAALPDNDVVGIGSKFSIMIFDKDETLFLRVELINRAVSDEFEGEYVELLSPLGNAIYGLKNNGEFSFKNSDDKYVCGIVYDIDNSKDTIKAVSPLAYQYQKRMSSSR